MSARSSWGCTRTLRNNDIRIRKDTLEDEVCRIAIRKISKLYPREAFPFERPSGASTSQRALKPDVCVTRGHTPHFTPRAAPPSCRLWISGSDSIHPNLWAAHVNQVCSSLLSTLFTVAKVVIPRVVGRFVIGVQGPNP
jgi:hypothetical protein